MDPIIERHCGNEEEERDTGPRLDNETSTHEHGSLGFWCRSSTDFSTYFNFARSFYNRFRITEERHCLLRSVFFIRRAMALGWPSLGIEASFQDAKLVAFVSRSLAENAGAQHAEAFIDQALSLARAAVYVQTPFPEDENMLLELAGEVLALASRCDWRPRNADFDKLN